MSIIYEPQGRAGEYAKYAANLFSGCRNSCKYCYAPAVIRRKAEDFHASCTARKDVVKLIKKEAKAYKDKEVLLCFTCDPYPNDTTLVDEVTRPVLKAFAKEGVIANVLTKNPMRAMRDCELFARYGFKLGTTLIFTDDANRKIWEPDAESVDNRIMAIEFAKKRDIYTWVSVEPVIDVDEALSVIKRLHKSVDFWKVGKLNGRDAETREIEASIDWKKFYYDAVALLDELKADYYIKEDLKQFGEE